MWREIIEDPTFTPRFRQIVPNPQLLDELLTGVMWALARAPELTGRRIGTTGLWVTEAELPPLKTSILIYYSFDDTSVTLHYAEVR